MKLAQAGERRVGLSDALRRDQNTVGLLVVQLPLK